MISVEEAAANMQAIHTAMSVSRLNLGQGRISQDEYQASLDRLALDHQKAWERAQRTQDAMNQANSDYIQREWQKNHPPERKRIIQWDLSRDDRAELHLWWDWKQLDDDVKREMLPPPCPSEMTQAFMDTNPAWKFKPDGTLVAAVSPTQDAFEREVARQDALEIRIVVAATSFFLPILIVLLFIWVH